MSRGSSVWNAFLSSTFGSDELQSYSAEYTWLANQMAHAMMGFFLAAILSWFIRLRNGESTSHMGVAFIPFAIPLLKVLPDALVVQAQSTFAVSWAEFFADKATDLSFWYVGMFAALLLFFPREHTRRKWAIGVGIFVTWLGLSIWLVSAWTEQKRTFDDSKLPPGWIRVSQYKTEYLGDDQTRPDQVKKVETYLDFIRKNDRTRIFHLIIRGGRAEDRSDLAVALGTEWAAKVRPVRYVTAARLLEDPQDVSKWVQANNSAGIPAVIVDDLIDLVPGEPAPERSVAYRAALDQLSRKTLKVPSGAPPTSALKPGEVRVLSTLWNVRAAIQESDYKVSTVWAVGGSPERTDLLVKELREILAGENQVVDEVTLGPSPPADERPTQPRQGAKRAGHRY